jgi:nicotinamide-nucleotide adenylyltransferase
MYKTVSKTLTCYCLKSVNVISFANNIVAGVPLVQRGLFIGRFQPFHLGHLKVIRDILHEVDELLIVLGSPQYSHRIENPFTAGERIVMIRNAIGEANIEGQRVWIIPVPDVHWHMMWVSLVEGYTPKFQTVYSNEPLTRRLFLEAGYDVKKVPLYKREVFSSTEIRRRILGGESWENLVPKSVAQHIREIDGVNRVIDLAKTDQA